MLPILMQWLAVYLCLAVRILAAPATNNTSLLAPRYDYEPGDTLTRTFCYCTTNPDTQDGLVDTKDSFQDKPGQYMAFHYKFDYYNHRLDQTMSVTGDHSCSGMGELQPEGSGTLGVQTDHRCLEWDNLSETYCHTFRFSELPEGINTDHDFEFCYFHEDKARVAWDVGDNFKFDGDTRNVPSDRDSSAPPAEVDETCKAMCSDKGMSVFKDEENVTLHNMIDGFHCLKGKSVNQVPRTPIILER
ncbi:MAG: hypothetical protein Q9174_005856 [Haloplaca sp. 1 TL-2023]